MLVLSHVSDFFINLEVCGRLRRFLVLPKLNLLIDLENDDDGLVLHFRIVINNHVYVFFHRANTATIEFSEMLDFVGFESNKL